MVYRALPRVAYTHESGAIDYPRSPHAVAWSNQKKEIDDQQARSQEHRLAAEAATVVEFGKNQGTLLPRSEHGGNYREKIIHVHGCCWNSLVHLASPLVQQQRIAKQQRKVKNTF